MTPEELNAQRTEKDQFFKASPHSPLSQDQQDTFTGLRYYEPNPALDLTVTVERLPSGDNEIVIETTTGDSRRYRRYGRFSFQLEGQTAELTIYEAPHGFFLPFVDANAGSETYPAGRYLEPEDLGGSQFQVDFNLAYNPYCAYNEGWSCPITPVENRLKAAIRAGEKNPEGKWTSLE
ncbi:MAG: DUF1684 domain-containing protein [Chloroflexota bacterium]